MCIEDDSNLKVPLPQTSDEAESCGKARQNMDADQQIWSRVPYCVTTGLCGGINPNACHCHFPSHPGIWALILTRGHSQSVTCKDEHLTLSAIQGQEVPASEW